MPPDLHGAIDRHYKPARRAQAAKQKAHEDALDADAELYGTAAYAALPASRRAAVEHRALERARTSGKGPADDAAA